MKTVDDVLCKMRYGVIPKHRHDRELLMNFADLVEKAVKQEREATCKDSLQIGNAANMRETDGWLNQLVNLINGEIAHYMSQGVECFSVDCGSWHIQYDRAKG